MTKRAQAFSSIERRFQIERLPGRPSDHDAADAGTVLKIDQVKQAGDLGATLIVAPGFNPEVVGYCIENGSRVIPGISNPTDIEMASSSCSKW